MPLIADEVDIVRQRAVPEETFFSTISGATFVVVVVPTSTVTEHYTLGAATPSSRTTAPSEPQQTIINSQTFFLIPVSSTSAGSLAAETNSSKYSISAGENAAIGVGVPLFVLGVGFLVFYILRYRRRLKNALANSEHAEVKAEMDGKGSHKKSTTELDGQPISELGTDNKNKPIILVEIG